MRYREHKFGPLFWRTGELPKPDAYGLFRWAIHFGKFGIAWARRHRGYLIIRTPFRSLGESGWFYPTGFDI